MKFGFPVTPDQVDKMLEDREDFDRVGRCGQIYDNASLARLGYYHNDAPGGYGESEGLWFRNGFLKGLPVIIVSAVKNIDNDNPTVIGSEEDGKYPGE